MTTTSPFHTLLKKKKENRVRPMTPYPAFGEDSVATSPLPLKITDAGDVLKEEWFWGGKWDRQRRKNRRGGILRVGRKTGENRGGEEKSKENKKKKKEEPGGKKQKRDKGVERIERDPCVSARWRRKGSNHRLSPPAPQRLPLGARLNNTVKASYNQVAPPTFSSSLLFSPYFSPRLHAEFILHTGRRDGGE